MTRRWDYALLLTTLVVVAFGLVMVFSASYVTAQEWTGGDSWYYAKRQAMWAGVGLLGLLAAARLPLRVLRRAAPALFALALVALVATLFIGVERHGARRWIEVMGYSIQPSEFAKLALIAFLACLYADRAYAFSRWQALVPGLGAMGVCAGLVLLGRDLGTALVIGAVGWLLLHLAGARMRHLLVALSGAAALGVFFIWSEPYRWQRITAWLNPWADAEDSGYQIVHSLIALGSGGPFGLGLGESRQKFFYLPTPMTDSIFAVLGEELGLLGTLGVIAAFLFLLWRGVTIVHRAGDSFAALVAGGVTMLLAVQAAVHIGVATSLLPTTGLPLPFFSYGGSALVTAMIGVGLLLNVARQERSGRVTAHG